MMFLFSHRLRQPFSPRDWLNKNSVLYENRARMVGEVEDPLIYKNNDIDFLTRYERPLFPKGFYSELSHRFGGEQ